MSEEFDVEEEFEEEENYYEARLDRIFNNDSMWPHRSFRTVLDPYSSEWRETNFNQKIQYLEKVLASGESLEMLIMEYKMRYQEQNREDIASSVETALLKLLMYQLEKK